MERETEYLAQIESRIFRPGLKCGQPQLTKTPRDPPRHWTECDLCDSPGQDLVPFRIKWTSKDHWFGGSRTEKSKLQQNVAQMTVY